MGQVAYYIPGAATLDDLAAAGLPDRFDAGRVTLTPAAGETAPDGAAGMIYSRRPLGSARPEWRRLPGPAWLGTVGQVRPRDVQRDRRLRGFYVTLADGNPWLIPLVCGRVDRPEAERCGLPLRVTTGTDGAPQARVAPRYAGLIDQVARLPELLVGWPDHVDQVVDVAGELLLVGHRIGAPEAAALELFDGDNLAAIAAAALDLVGAAIDGSTVVLSVPGVSGG